ncbi:putative RNA-directed DNA polymerase [Tanacetum coccineum]
MEQDPQMDHDQTNEPSGPHETHDGDETDQINDEGQPNNDEFETNESNEGAEAQAETRPTPTRTQPSRFKDFVIQVPPSVKHPTSTSNQVTSIVRYPISNFVSYNKFSTNHKAFLVAITNNDETKCFKQAAQDDRWREAMQKEVKALEKNSTWTLEDLPERKRAIDSKWVYKIKFKPNGEVERDWIIHQLDVDNAFLHGDLDEEVYMKIPQGFSNDNETRVCRLRKSLYGLKQASLNCIMVVVLIYVDDVIITGNNLTKIQETKKQLDDEFNIKDLGLLKYFLGIEVAKTKDGLVLSQRKYTLDILENSGKMGCKSSAFPIEQGLKLDKGESESRVNASQYRRLIDQLLYLQATRPDITYSVNILSQFVADSQNSHLEAANRVLGYLKATPGQGILISRSGDPILTAYCDSDWLGCPYTRRSRTGYMLLLGGTPISWKTKKQSLVSRSSTEAEYKAIASTVTARHIANNPVFHERTKHVEMDCYFVRERVESKEIIPMKISSKMQIVDLLTKGLSAHQLQFLLGKIALQICMLHLKGE